jgi:hypothetical protein
MVPIEKLDSTWAIQALGSEVRHLQTLLARTERNRTRDKALLVGCGVALVAALVMIGRLCI